MDQVARVIVSGIREELNFLINTPAPRGSTKGNRITANRWARFLRQMGHQVSITNEFDSKRKNHRADCLIAIHATRSSKAVSDYRNLFPQRPILVCLSGTDVHGDMQAEPGSRKRNAAMRSLALANQIILLEPECKRLLSPGFSTKAHVIVQSAQPVINPPGRLVNSFEVTVIGHLRDEKDPMRAAIAARSLPDDSKIQIRHFGTAYNARFARLAEMESRNNPRYQWLGGRSHGEVQRRLARSVLHVLSSRQEGAPSVISEAIVNDVPILATRIHATIGLLGNQYPGFFEVEDTDALAQLMHRAETDQRFYQSLKQAGRKLKKRFAPAAEKKAWQHLIKQLRP